MKLKMIAVVALAMLTVPAMAADDDAAKPKKKGKGGGANVATQMMKQLADVGLTEEQTMKIKELGKTSMGSMKTLREEVGITPELMKKRAAAQKSVKDSGKKGKEMVAAITEAAGLTEDQAAGFAKLEAARRTAQKSILALLTDEQKEKLPANLKRMLNAGKKGGGKKKKKKDAA